VTAGAADATATVARGATASKVLHRLRVEPGEAAGIADRDPRETFGLTKDDAPERLADVHRRLELLHRRLFAEAKRSVLLVLQGMDAAGKDGVIRRVFTGLNPQGCRVIAFREPTSTELAHDYLWRVHAALPARGEIGIFNRSHYEDVIAVRMLRLVPEEVWRRRPGHIREWERMLADEGTTLVKVFLHVSREEERARLEERREDPEKRWKFREADLDVNDRYDEYVAAYEETITETSTAWAPWHVVPADRNWLKGLLVAELLAGELERLDPRFPA
jgi:PPK2 family polyphosphate:nucleotide phosphotransferase